MIVSDIKSLILKLNLTCSNALQDSAGLCVNKRNYEITVEHLILKLVEEKSSDIFEILNYFQIDIEKFKIELSNSIQELETGCSSKPVFSPLLIELIQDAWSKSSIDFEHSTIRSGVITIVLLKKLHHFFNSKYNSLIRKINVATLEDEFYVIVRKSVEKTVNSSDSNEESEQLQTNFISKYCSDITKKARDGKIDAVFGRDSEIRLIIDILARRRKNNPILVGEPGVGKSAVVEGLALKIINGDVPLILKDVQLIELDLTSLQAGAGVKGEFENRLKGVIKEIQSSPTPIILFIDEAHTLIGAGGNAGTEDAANLLKPMLARGELRTIAATTWGEYKKYFEKDAALARRFQLIKLDEPSVDNATLILRGLKPYYEKSHQVNIRDEAIVSAAKLSNKYIIGRFLPDKAIDLLDTACARIKINLNAKPDILDDKEQELKAIQRENDSLNTDLNLGLVVDKNIIKNNLARIKTLDKEIKDLTKFWENELKVAKEIIEIKDKIQETTETSELSKLKKELKIKKDILSELKKEHNLVEIDVNSDIVAKVVSDWTGIPLGKMLRDESQAILELDIRLKDKIKGQDYALDKISEQIRASKVGIKDPNHPMGVFLLVGPSGVGKTQTAIELAELLFNNKSAITSINMSEFQEKHTVSRLIGSPPGYVGYGEGGLLSEAVRKKPYSVVLLDEVEKAHPDIMNLFYQVFDKGILTDGEGKEISFKDTVIILTSNLASEITQEHFATSNKIDAKAVENLIRPRLVSYFKPALLARMTVLPYVVLDKDSLILICKEKFNKLKQRVSQNSIELKYDDKLIDFIVEKISNSDSGARDIERLINIEIVPNISKYILNSLVSKASTKNINISVDENNNLMFS